MNYGRLLHGINMASPPEKETTPLATILFRREALVFLITLVCAVIIFILSLGVIFQTMWDQATQSVRLEIDKEADTIARLLVFEFSHLTELATQVEPDRAVDERVERLLWEKVTFNETYKRSAYPPAVQLPGATSDVLFFP